MLEVHSTGKVADDAKPSKSLDREPDRRTAALRLI
jgi:hypothetical protein